MNLPRLLSSLLLLPVSVLLADDQPQERTPEQILQGVTLPAGYSATIFARPPSLGYPTSISAAPDGTVFVAVDENGSLDRKEKRGKVVRLRDTDGDGVADEQKTFAEMDSPRGVIWDGPRGDGPGALYVMHPPNLTAYYDDDGDGVADRQDDLVTGLGFDLKFRGADHTTNGCRLAIDGYIYIAVGDYGYVEAKGKDGTTIKNRGGGIVRVRTDGTGLEIVSRGQRNIYDVAVSPTLDIFTRDNTNDGGGWNVRLSYVPPGAHMGYPYYFKNFPEDRLETMADYGGGSPCGALWLDEPGLPQGLFTVEWGASAIMYHGLKQHGAGWEVDGPNKGQTPWLKMTRPTDMDVDGHGALYIASWEGATFNYNGPYAGYVLRVVKNDAPKVEVPDFAKAPDQQLADLLAGPSATLRLAAQREVLRRLAKGQIPQIGSPHTANGVVRKDVESAALLATAAQAARISKGNLDLLTDEVRGTPLHQVLLALLDATTPSLATAKVSAFVLESLQDANPRVRAAAIIAARRLHLEQSAPAFLPALLPLVAEEDAVISHLAVRLLTEARAADVCLGALDSADEKVKPGALRALYGMYEPPVVDGLLARLSGSQGDQRRGILNALCRLDNQDELYVDPKVWWGTRPDTSGPVYKPVKWSESAKIEAALKQEINAGNEEDARWLITRMYATKVNFPGLIELMLTKAGNDTPAKLTAIEGLFSPENVLPGDALAAAQAVASQEAENPELRARALRLIQRANQQKSSMGEVRDAALKAAVAVYAPLVGHDLPHPALTAAVDDFTHAAPNWENLGSLERMAVGSDPAPRTLAQTILVNAATSSVIKGQEKDRSVAAVEKMWTNPDAAASLLGVIARVKAKGMAEQVKAHLKDPNNAVAEAALFAYQSLGLSETGGPGEAIGTLGYEKTFAAVAKGGDVKQGQEMFLRAGCIACHTVSEAEPPKGPNLAATAKIYDRAALTESILKPNAKIAQGFETQWFKTKKGEQVEGFVTREGGDSLDVRNIAGQTQTLEKGDLAERGKRETSIMPEGLLNPFSPTELASLLAYLESLKGKP